MTYLKRCPKFGQALLISVATMAGFAGPALADTFKKPNAVFAFQAVSEDAKPASSDRMKAWRERIAKVREDYLARLEERRSTDTSRATQGLRAAASESKRPQRQSRVINRGRMDEAGNRAGRASSWNNERPGRVTFQKPKAPAVNHGGPFGNLIAKYAAQHGVPYALGRAVVQVESTFRPNVTGGAGEIGLMQIKLSTARGMGFKGTRQQLYDPATNLYWGMKYLGKA
ncbi:MAG: transglycosylase SLT domain-containing protein, partial [Pseudomonadota bacterium]